MATLAGLRVLVVEDEPIVAMCLEDILIDMGCTVVGPASTLAHGLALATAEALDVAILDINLGATVTSAPIAEALAARSIPTIFATGYGYRATGIADGAVVAKPYGEQAIRAALAHVLALD